MTMMMDEENHRNRFRTKMITNIVRNQDQIVGGKKRRRPRVDPSRSWFTSCPVYEHLFLGPSTACLGFHRKHTNAVFNRGQSLDQAVGTCLDLSVSIMQSKQNCMGNLTMYSTWLMPRDGRREAWCGLCSQSLATQCST
jgi:hypothetical protein